MTDSGSSRRTFLRTGAGLAAAASAGCIEALPPLGQRVPFGSVDPPEGRGVEYRRWLPSEGALADREFDLWPNVVATPSRDGSEVVGEPVGIGRGFVSGTIDYFGVGIEHYDLVLWFGSAAVLEGPVDPDEVGSTLEETGYEATDAYEGYERYERADVPRTAAVADGEIVWASGERDREQVETLIDARDGRLERRHEADSHFDEVSSLIGGRPFLMLGSEGTSPIESRPTELSVSGFDADDQAVYWLNYVRYEDGVDVSADELRAELDSDIYTDTASDVDVSVEDSLARIETRMTHEAFLADRSFEAYPPQVTWGVEADGDRVRLVHEAGDTVPAERLEFRTLDGDAMEPQPTDGDEVLSAGSTVELDRADLETDGFRLFWVAPDESTRSVLFEYELP